MPQVSRDLEYHRHPPVQYRVFDDLLDLGKLLRPQHGRFSSPRATTVSSGIVLAASSLSLIPIPIPTMPNSGRSDIVTTAFVMTSNLEAWAPSS